MKAITASRVAVLRPLLPILTCESYYFYFSVNIARKDITWAVMLLVFMMGKQRRAASRALQETTVDCPHCVCRRHSWSLFGNGIPTLLWLSIGVSK